MLMCTTAHMNWLRCNLRVLLASLLLSTSGLSLADVLVGQVVGVSDGDTITLLDANKTQHKIRLAGIDAPEKAQPFGQASKKSLSDLIFQKEVHLNWEKKDRYQRLIEIEFDSFR